MVELWYAILVLTLGLYVVLDGWDLGIGALHLSIGRTDADRRTVISAIGPFWLWHEVWLVAAGGIMVLAFPAVMGTAFSGLYLALMLVLWGLMGRGMAIEVAGHIKDRLWRTFWDITFSLSSVLLAVLLGAAFGNLLRGVPMSPEGRFSLPFFTHFGVRGAVGLLDWYTVSVAAFTLVCLMAHGAAFLALRTDGKVNLCGLQRQYQGALYHGHGHDQPSDCGGGRPLAVKTAPSVRHPRPAGL
jgi:cytochrome d ubiquinol oxidase subunit II